MTILTVSSLQFPGPKALWRGYNVNLERRPIATKSITSVVGFAIGDAVAQWSGKPKSREDFWRFAALLSSSATQMPCVQHIQLPRADPQPLINLEL